MRMPVALKDGTREIDVKLMDDGRVLVHWLMECDDGPIMIESHPSLTHPSRYKDRKVVVGQPIPFKYTLACRPQQNTVNSQKRGDVRFLCMTTGDVTAATCPACLATKEAVEKLTKQTNDPAASQMAMDTVQEINRGTAEAVN